MGAVCGFCCCDPAPLHPRTQVVSYKRIRKDHDPYTEEGAENTPIPTAVGAVGLDMASIVKPHTSEFEKESCNLEAVATIREVQAIEFPPNTDERLGEGADDHRAQQLERGEMKAEELPKQSDEHHDVCGDNPSNTCKKVEDEAAADGHRAQQLERGEVKAEELLKQSDSDDHHDTFEDNGCAQEMCAVQTQMKMRDLDEVTNQRGNLRRDSSALDLDVGSDNGRAHETIDKGQSQHPVVRESQAKELAKSSLKDELLDYEERCVTRDIEMIDAALRILDD
mmetsp:Transcript_23021/g.32186  ORF Transcript_23021/g.32186 Transcript_23021/m.32186 type:complete len:281 (-) Transcript_23021:56-898(-)